MQFEHLLAFPAVKKIIDIVRYALEGDVVQYKEIAIVLASFAAGFGAVALAAASSFAPELMLEGTNIADQILIGIGVGASAGTAVDLFNGSATVV